MKRIYNLLMLLAFVSLSFGQFNPDPNQWYKFVNKNSRKNLQPINNSTADGANIVQITNALINSQQWKFISVSGGYYKIQNRNSGKLMDISGASKNDGANAIQYKDNGGANQQWQIINMSNGFFTVKNKNSGKLLEINGSSLSDGAQAVQRSSNGGKNQQWQIVKIASTNYKLGDNDNGANFQKGLRIKDAMTSYGKKRNDGMPAPSAFNWRDNSAGGMGPIYNQDSCNSCWAMAAKSAYEIKLLMKGYSPVDISAQQQISCNTDNSGCVSGNGYYAFHFWEINKPELTQCTGYPDIYTRSPTKTKTLCSSISACTTGVQLPLMAGNYSLDPTVVNDMKASIYWDGPGYLSLLLYDDFWNYYNSAALNSVYTENGVGVLGSHGVAVIGWDDTKNAYLCKSSWGPGGPNGDGTFWVAYSGHTHTGILRYFYNESALGGNFWITTGVGSTNPGVKRYIRQADATYIFSNVSYPAGVNCVGNVAGDPRGFTYIADSSGIVWSRTPKGTWTQILGILAQDISLASNLSAANGIPVMYVYAISRDGNLQACPVNF